MQTWLRYLIHVNLAKIALKNREYDKYNREIVRLAYEREVPSCPHPFLKSGLIQFPSTIHFPALNSTKWSVVLAVWNKLNFGDEKKPNNNTKKKKKKKKKKK
jgi:hypothetical protein